MSDLIRRLRLNGDENIALGDDKRLYIEAADEITRLSAELEQARGYAEKLQNHFNEALGEHNAHIMEQARRAEAAEQQVAALVDGYLEIMGASDEEMANGELAKDIADNLLCTLSDRAKKIQAVLEPAKELEIMSRTMPQSMVGNKVCFEVNEHEPLFKLILAVRDLES